MHRRMRFGAARAAENWITHGAEPFVAARTESASVPGDVALNPTYPARYWLMLDQSESEVQLVPGGMMSRQSKRTRFANKMRVRRMLALFARLSYAYIAEQSNPPARDDLVANNTTQELGGIALVADFGPAN